MVRAFLAVKLFVLWKCVGAHCYVLSQVQVAPSNNAAVFRRSCSNGEHSSPDGDAFLSLRRGRFGDTGAESTSGESPPVVAKRPRRRDPSDRHRSGD